MKYIGRILVCSVLLMGCQTQDSYTFDEIRPEVEAYLSPLPLNDFTSSDTLIIYDAIYFDKMIATLSRYQDKLVVEDSLYQQQIVQQLMQIKEDKIQTRQPQIYLPFQAIQDELQPQNAVKIAAWLTALPKQIEAAKSQLKQPDLLHTQQTIEDLKAAYTFVTSDLNEFMMQSNAVEDYEEVIENTKFAIKDYLAFLTSKVLNGEVESER